MPDPLPEPLLTERESPVEVSRRLRRDARARIEAAQRALSAAGRSYGWMLDRRLAPDRRRGAPGRGRRGGDDLGEELFQGFLDTEPQIHWLPDLNMPEAVQPGTGEAS